MDLLAGRWDGTVERAHAAVYETYIPAATNVIPNMKKITAAQRRPERRFLRASF
jgi:hypothetical protein